MSSLEVQRIDCWSSCKDRNFILLISFACIAGIMIGNIPGLLSLALLGGYACFSSNENVIALFFSIMLLINPIVNAILLSMLTVIFLLKSDFRLRIYDKSGACILVAIILWVGADILAAENTVSAVKDVISWLFVFCVYMICQSFSFSTSINKMLLGLMIGGVTVSIIYATKILLGIETASDYWILRIPDTNISSTILFLTIIIIDYLKSMGIINLKLSIILKGLLIFSIFLEGSRGIESLTLIYIILLIYGKRSNATQLRYLLKIAFPLGAAAGFLLICNTEFFKQTISSLASMFDSSNTSNSIRISIYKDIMLRMFPENPICGIGPGNFEEMYYQHYASIDFQASHAHSIFLQVLAEHGLVGFLLFSAFVVQLVSRAKVVFYNSCEFKNLYIWFIATFIFYGAIEHLFGDSRCFAFILAVFSMYKNLLKGNSKCLSICT